MAVMDSEISIILTLPTSTNLCRRSTQSTISPGSRQKIQVCAVQGGAPVIYTEKELLIFWQHAIFMTKTETEIIKPLRIFCNRFGDVSPTFLWSINNSLLIFVHILFFHVFTWQLCTVVPGSYVIYGSETGDVNRDDVKSGHIFA
jgi:hypothetical protein